MNHIKNKRIVFGLIILFFFFVFLMANKEDSQFEYPGTCTHPQSQSLKSSFNSVQSYSPSYPQSNFSRHEILQKKVKGYREQTYWGSEHPTHEKTRYMNDDEFGCYINEEIELKDADVYWGAEY